MLFIEISAPCKPTSDKGKYKTDSTSPPKISFCSNKTFRLPYICFINSPPNGCVIKITTNAEIINVSKGTKKSFNIPGIILRSPLSTKAAVIPATKAISKPPISGK